MSTPESRPIRALPLTRTVDLLSEAEIEAVHARTLDVLGRTGVSVGSPELARRLADAGAVIEIENDGPAHRVRLPEQAVMGALEHPPRSFTLAGRAGGTELELDGSHGYLSVDGCAAEIVDIETGDRRASTTEDLASVTRIADAIPEISMVWQAVAARDAPAGVESLHELRAQLRNTGKHIQMMTATTPFAARGVVDIARAAAGGDDALRRRPIVSAFQCSLSPLKYDGEALEAALVYAEAGVPCGFVVMPITCASAPASVAGTLVVANAEALAGIVIQQLLAPGAPTFYGCCATVMDLIRGTAACGGPEDIRYQMASAQLARYYGVPSSIGTFATGAKRAGWQAGVENGMSGFASALAGADMLGGAGLVYGAQVFSPMQMVLDADVFRLLCDLVGGPSAAPDASITDVIDTVGPGGHFLAQPHTINHMRELFLPRYFDRTTWRDWDAAGQPDAAERALETVQSILESHHPVPLDPAVDEEITSIIAAAEEAAPGHNAA
jgi:trimethylamine--corrinoid protein Co-methyltransferase